MNPRPCLLFVGLLFAAGSAAPGPAHAASPGQGGGCTVRVDKVASPARVRLGESVQVRLSLEPDCPPSTFRAGDAVLVIDRSMSMLSDGKIAAAKAAASAFVDATDLTANRIAVLGFNSDAQQYIGLSGDGPAIKQAINAIGIRTGTNIARAIDIAAALLKKDGRDDALPVIILITDGSPNQPAPDPELAAQRSANAAKLAGVHVFAIGLGESVDHGLMRSLASTPTDYYFSPSTAELEIVYRSIALQVGTFAARDLVVDDDLAANLLLVPGSISPDATQTGDVLRWSAGLVPTDGLTWVYNLTPTIAGTIPTNDRATATYRDIDGTPHTVDFPLPFVTVVDPRSQNFCDRPGGWTIMVHSFPDSVGISGAGVPGCNNNFDSGDWAEGTRYTLPPLEYELSSATSGELIYVGKGVPGPGRVDQRLYVRVCEPPPYRLRLVATDLGGYRLCVNSPAERTITLRDFRPTVFQRTEARYGYVR